MDRVQVFKSIRQREQKVLGIYSFSEPIVPEFGTVTTGLEDRENPGKKRRNQVIQAQRNHRKRTQEYMTALEDEIQRLRHAAADLNQVSSDWKRCALALIGPSRGTPSRDRWAGRIGPGVFTWAVTDVLPEDVEFSTKQLSWLLFPSETISHFSHEIIPSPMEIYDAATRELLLNFHENITPTLDVTETAGYGYARHIIPLALESDMVRNALLAASASQMQVTRKAMTVKSLRYRSAAISGLQNASKQPRTDKNYALLTLATILGLLIDDMINENKDFPALVRLADSWIILNPSDSDRSHEQLRKFLLDQIQMLKTLVYPLYKFSESYSPTNKSFTSSNSSIVPLNHLNISDIFTNLESAMAQACFIYRSRSSTSVSTSTPIPSASSNELDRLLDSLQSTVSNIPPFAPGENTLVWVYSIAASHSTSAKHCAFFTSRLAELLSRTGHQDISGYLAAVSIS